MILWHLRNSIRTINIQGYQAISSEFANDNGALEYVLLMFVIKVN